MTSFSYLGKALIPTNTDLDALAQTAANGAATATAAKTTADLAVTALAIVPDPAAGRTTTTLQAYISNTAMLWLKDFGVVGDGIEDDTDAVQAALDAGASQGRVVNGGNAICVVTAPLTMSGAGLVFDAAGFGNAGDPGLVASGTGFGATPVLTISGQPCAMNFTLYGSGQAAHGILFDNPQRATGQQVRVYNLDGYGIKINKCWDCVFEVFSVELCGNATDYAFSMNDDGDTCNMTHISRLQVERATTQAISISPNSLSLTIDAIHSEGLISPDSAKSAWILGGASCSFNNARFSSTGTAADANLWLRSAWSDYTALRAEGVTTILEGTSTTGLTLVSPALSGTTKEFAGQSGALCILGGTYGTWSGSTANRFTFQGAGAYLATTGGTLTGTVTMNSAAGAAGASTWRKTSSYKGYALSAGDTGSLASGAGSVVDLADGNTAAVVLITNDGGEGALFLLQGGAHNTVYLTLGGGTGTWSTAVATVATNVYWNAGSSTYRLQNLSGSTRTYYVAKIGGVPTA